ncbi:Flp pilus assembly protein CpaB [Sphingosinicella sp. BN140058]|uniref:Flp pilus assembly protein CpaB n=1 Tax=Sphingosinicella sp. BN140058 TaxID=1892855 RepID=UPI001010D7B6|nr:Flp pilus assembly protein CpaB [Sphingosinicella sp. BN140058]QAY79577.1 Flp pilus assembly protein CpaB [Sphingosinicella sp. BN140058]
MDVKKIVLLVGALIVAAVTAVTARNMFNGAAAPEAVATPVVPAGPEVLVATRSLPVGTIIDAESLRYQAWPEGLVQPAYYIKGNAAASPQDLIGTVVRTEITAGQPVTTGSLIKPGERGYLAAALGPGMRAVTVAVSATSSVAGFIFPGDRVDIVLTQEVTGEGPPLKASETVVRNIRVLATDQRMSAEGEDGKPVVQNFSLVTLEATPKIAEKIAVMQTIGTLSLSLRAMADNSAELERAIASGEVTVPENADPKTEKRMLIEIANKPVDSDPSVTVGADVSRFQRSSVPARNSGIGQAPAAPLTAAAAAQPVRPAGPTVRIARGNNVTIVPLGAK